MAGRCSSHIHTRSGWKSIRYFEVERFLEAPHSPFARDPLLQLLALTFLFIAAAAATALACISVISGYTTDRRQPRKPSMGFTYVVVRTRSAGGGKVLKLRGRV